MPLFLKRQCDRTLRPYAVCRRFGLSDKPATGHAYSLFDHAERLLEFCRQLQLRQVLAMGREVIITHPVCFLYKITKKIYRLVREWLHGYQVHIVAHDMGDSVVTELLTRVELALDVNVIPTPPFVSH